MQPEKNMTKSLAKQKYLNSKAISFKLRVLAFLFISVSSGTSNMCFFEYTQIRFLEKSTEPKGSIIHLEGMQDYLHYKSYLETSQAPSHAERLAKRICHNSISSNISLQFKRKILVMRQKDIMRFW